MLQGCVFYEVDGKGVKHFPLTGSTELPAASDQFRLKEDAISFAKGAPLHIHSQMPSSAASQTLRGVAVSHVQGNVARSGGRHHKRERA